MTDIEKLAVKAVGYDELIVRLEKLAHQQADVKGDSSYDGERMLTHEDTMYWAARAVILTLTARNRELEEALRRIANWEMPPSCHTWQDGSEMSYSAAYGSNGERDVIRAIARSALTPKPDGE